MCFDWCVPKFFHGTCFKMKLSMKYDRIYVGAKVPVGMRMHFVKMLKVGGVCIMPYGSTVSIQLYHYFLCSNVVFFSFKEFTDLQKGHFWHMKSHL